MISLRTYKCYGTVHSLQPMLLLENSFSGQREPECWMVYQLSSKSYASFKECCQMQSTVWLQALMCARIPSLGREMPPSVPLCCLELTWLVYSVRCLHKHWSKGVSRQASSSEYCACLKLVSPVFWSKNGSQPYSLSFLSSQLATIQDCSLKQLPWCPTA